MDLVAAYDSDDGKDSDIEEIRSSPVKKRIKSIDVVDLESDSDNETAIKKRKTETSTKHKETKRSSKHIDCIDLDGSSDADSPIKSSKQKSVSDSSSKKTDYLHIDSSDDNSPNKSSKQKSISDSSKNKVDFLHIESSDSDTEFQSNDDKVKDLMKSASVLNDVPSGPVKPSEALAIPITLNKPVDKHDDIVQISNSNIDITCNSDRNTPNANLNLFHNNAPDTSSLNLDFSQFKTGFTFDTSNAKSNQNECKDKEKVSCIYEEDARVIEASKKNVVCRIPRQIVQTHVAHSNIIMALNWCIPQYSHLFLSASLDCSVKIWDLYRQNPVQRIAFAAGINAAQWSRDGGQIVAGGNGKKAFVYDVQTGLKLLDYEIYNYVTSLAIHPYIDDVFLCGTRNAILGFDCRVNSSFPVRSFFSHCEEVLDLAFIDENEFICSTNIVSQDSADRTIMAWDFSSGAKLSNQIYLERYTCPSLKVHPTDSSFVAQTNGNYIASFSTSRPYKVKNKRYVGHKVSGYGIECDISPDGKYLASGDAEGGVYFYNYSNTSAVLSSVVKAKIPTNRLKWHPAFPSTIITSSYDGHIQIWK